MFITHGGILGPHAQGTTQDGVTLVVRLLCVRGLGPDLLGGEGCVVSSSLVCACVDNCGH